MSSIKRYNNLKDSTVIFENSIVNHYHGSVKNFNFGDFNCRCVLHANPSLWPANIDSN